MTKKVGAYIRVSTEEQALQGVSLAAQEEALKNYCKTFGYEIHRVYRDKGKSGKSISGRPAMLKLLEDAEAKKFDAIIIYKLDRFSRSVYDLIVTIKKLKQWDVDFISLQDKIDTTSAMGKFQFHLFGALAELEKDMIGERTKFGMQKKAKDGAIVNRAPLGYLIKNKRLVIDPKGKDKVNEIFEVYAKNNISLNKLSKKYGFTVRGITKLLRNRTYLGEVTFDKKGNKGNHESIINKDLFEKVQEKLNKNKKQKLLSNS